MRIGPLEIGIVLLAVFSVALAIRVFRGNRSVAAQKEKLSLDIAERQAVQNTGKGNRLKIASVVLVLVGVLLLLSGLNLLRWVVKSYVWSFILVAIGIVVFWLSRKR